MVTHLRMPLILLASGLALGSTLPTLQSASAVDTPGLGDSQTTAIEVCKPPGERSYLDHLQCPDSSTPTYRRLGSFGSRNEPPKNLPEEQKAALLDRITSGAPLKPGETDYHIVDKFEVSCGDSKRFVYMDMYHCQQPPPSEAPIGFKLRGLP